MKDKINCVLFVKLKVKTFITLDTLLIGTTFFLPFFLENAVEVFAQLYYAKMFALRIALDAMETNSVFTLIKLAYYLRGLVRTYK